MKIITVSVIAVLCLVLPTSMAQTLNDTSSKLDYTSSMFRLAEDHFEQGEYEQAIVLYDEILEVFPGNISTLKMKGVAQSNLGYHKVSMEQFFRILQYQPDDIHALAGMGVGLGYLGEYKESKKYFEKALKINPENIMLQNYNGYIQKVIEKYPYTPTEKPEQLVSKITAKVPSWTENNIQWWLQEYISDSEFISSVQFLMSSDIITVSGALDTDYTNQDLSDIKKDIKGITKEKAFVIVLQYLLENKIIESNIKKQTQKELDDEFSYFKKYVRKIVKNVADEKRFVEFPNPSQDVIKKFLRDYSKWNLEESLKYARTFPDPTFITQGDTIVIQYGIFVNDQPSGLPLDHVETLKESVKFWESQSLTIDEKKARVDFEFTNSKSEANVWVTWVVRNLGEGVLGHANIGKGVVEVALGDYKCDGSFQLYDVQSVEYIMRHELGHTIGLGHVADEDNIMHRAYTPGYAYCLLG